MPKTQKKTLKKKPSKRKPNPVQPDDKLAAIVGSQPLPRPELTKKLWAYIKRHGSPDKKKRIGSKSESKKYVSAHTDSPGPGRHRGSR
jgi:chromatin remodeling complex protein RSC6